MNDEETLIELAKLDGYKYYKDSTGVIPFLQLGRDLSGVWKECDHPKDGDKFQWVYSQIPNYLTSRDAIIPVIIKLRDKTFNGFKFDITFSGAVSEHLKGECGSLIELFSLTPRELSICVLKGAGKYKE